MKPFVFLAILFSQTLPAAALAAALSPSGLEVGFSLESEFITSDTAPAARELVLTQSKHLFGYLHNEDLPKRYGLGKIQGLGAPRWEPEVEILSDRLLSEEQREVKYRMRGKLLLHKLAAAQVLPRREWQVELPYDLDNFWDEKCTDATHRERDEFWYFNAPFREGCEHLRQAPLAHPATLHLSPAPQVDEATPVGLAALRGDNGNGELFEITAINGFDESSTSPRDDGRVNFKAMNQWLREQGFEETVISKFKNRPVHQFDKVLPAKGGSPAVHVRITRLLAETDLDGGRHVTFAKFLKNAIENSDVVIYEGHSGLGANLNVGNIETRLLMSKDKKLAKKIDWNRGKKQVFFFDSCSSYSYYLGMFDGKKDPGTLAVVTNGLASLFGTELPVTKHLYRHLLQRDESLTWLGLLGDMEKPLRSDTFLLNVDLN